MRKSILKNYHAYFSAFLLITFITFSCRKTDLPNKEDSSEVKDKVASAKFYENSTSDDYALMRVIEKLKKTELPSGYIWNFTQNIGYPVWDKFKKYPKREDHTLSQSDTIIIIPIVPENGNYVSGFLQANISDTVSIFFKRVSDYKNYPFHDDGSGSETADKYALKFMELNKLVFNHKKFKINDKRIFSHLSDTTEHTIFVEFKDSTDNTSSNLTTQVCNNTEYTFLCSICNKFNCELTVTFVYTFCIEYDSGGGGTPWSGGPVPDPGGGGGPGQPGGGGGNPPNNCTDYNTCPQGPGGNTGWEPVTPVYQAPAIQKIYNNLTNPCLTEVFDKITGIEYINELSQMIRMLNSNNTVNVTLNQVSTLSNNVYATTYGTGGENYTIDFNNNILPKTSQEWIAVTFYHEVIHAYIKNHIAEYDFENNSQHQIMFENYYEKLVSALKETFPTISDRNARCIIYSDMFSADITDSNPVNQIAYEKMQQIRLLNIMRYYPDLNSHSDVMAVAELYAEDGPSGTRNPDCQ